MLELLNPASVFGGIMVDYGYVECTSACVQAMLAYRATYLCDDDEHGVRVLNDKQRALQQRIDAAATHAFTFITSLQQLNGSFYGIYITHSTSASYVYMCACILIVCMLALCCMLPTCTGSWAICYTYGTWFAVEACVALRNARLHSIDAARVHVILQRACAFLLSIQHADGGWGESFECCVQKKYVPSASSQIINTSWYTLQHTTSHYVASACISQ